MDGIPPGRRRARHRGRYVLGLAVVIAAGLASRSEWLALPPFLAKYAGDALWAVMVFLGLGLLLPTRRTTAVAGWAALVCLAVEVSQLYHAPWIVGLRGTWVGRMTLGSAFGWGDLAAYLVGIVLAGVIEWGGGCSVSDKDSLNEPGPASS